MKNLRWQIIIVIIALIAIGVLLIGQQPTVLPGIEVEVEPASGGTYTEALVGEMGRLNPLLDYNNPVDQDINRLLYSSLIRFDDRGIPIGDLADSWGISQDGKVYNFSIHSDALWHDGEPVTSDDVLFTVNLFREEAVPIPDDLRAFWQQVEIEIIDENTLQFRLPEPFAPFLDYLSFGLLPAHLLEGLPVEEIIDSEFNLNPIGSGPYKFDQMIVDDGTINGVTLRVFDDYYGDKPFIEEFNFLYYVDYPTALVAYQDEEVQGIGNVDRQILPQALQEPDLNMFSSRTPQLSMVLLNLGDPSQPYFHDEDVRRALLTAINRQAIINRFMDGQGVIAHGPILPGTWACS